MSRLFGYEQAREETGFSDRQYRRGYVTLRETDRSEDTFFVLFDTGNWAEMDLISLKVLQVHPGCEDWRQLEGKELVRFLPFRVIDCGYFPLSENPQNSVLKEAKKRIQEQEQVSRRHFEGTRSQITPAFTGDESCFRFYSRNGMEVCIYTVREWIREANCRRYYRRPQLPRNKEIESKKGYYYTVTASEDFIRKQGKNLDTALKGTLSEIRRYIPELDEPERFAVN